ncbi:immunity repressor [Gordonia phage SpeedDemon]|uniref:Immunity repressor n=1 Tax=Gordonia phage Bantam TaxID=1887641 RepID=A0A1B3AYC5_9CAUD|nr:transcriptional repressor [Gordonia phage Bantam]AOE43755.1 immunity repressor [Gordonia phage Bantam]QNL30518.1 immunity repressor [Gordonia phage SpeedDemon]
MQSLEVFARSLGREVTRNEIADALDVHVSTISRRITGREGFRIEEVLVMCDYFHVSRCFMLIELGHLEMDDVVATAGVNEQPIESLPDVALLRELTARAVDRERGEQPAGRKRSRGKRFLS